jgi:tRNA(Ile2) C34 agmatinyltransferase TiaS
MPLAYSDGTTTHCERCGAAWWGYKHRLGSRGLEVYRCERCGEYARATDPKRDAEPLSAAEAKARRLAASRPPVAAPTAERGYLSYRDPPRYTVDADGVYHPVKASTR